MEVVSQSRRKSLNIRAKISHRVEAEEIGQTKNSVYKDHDGDTAERTARKNGTET